MRGRGERILGLCLNHSSSPLLRRSLLGLRLTLSPDALQQRRPWLVVSTSSYPNIGPPRIWNRRMSGSSAHHCHGRVGIVPCIPADSTESQKRSPAHARRVSSIVLHRSPVANEPSGTEEASRIVFRLATRMWLEALDRVMSEAGAPPSLD